MGRLVMRLLFAALSVALAAGQGMAAQSTRNSVQGVWRVVEAVITGPGARTIAFGERPNLTIITARHYSRVEVQADGPRPVLPDVARATADELRAVWGPFVSEAGTYEVTPGGVITMRPIAAKNPAVMGPGVFTDSLGPRPEYKLEGTPLMVNGVLYTTAGTRRAVVALDAATGELRWVHAEHEGARAAASPRQLSGRGVAYWTDGRDERILYVTTGYRLVALDAKTGSRIPSFGKDGIVDLKDDAVFGKGQPIDLVNGEIGLHATPAVTRDGVVMIGAAFLEGGTPKTHNNTKGLVRGFDVRTGRRLWTFNTIPRPGEFGNETWLERIVGGQRQRRRLEPDRRRRRARPRVSAGRDAELGFLRRSSPRQQSVRREPRRDRLQDRPAQVALPARAPSDLEHGHRRGADPRRSHRRRTAGQGRRGDGQAGDALPVQSRDRRADLSDRGAAGAAVRRAGREDVADAAVSDQAAGVRSSGRHGRQPDRLHAGAARGGAEDRGALQDRTDLHAAAGQQGRRSDRGFRSSGGTNWPGGSFDPETHIAYVPSFTAMPVLGLLPPPNKEFSDLPYVSGNALTGVRYISGPGENVGADAPPPTPAGAARAPAVDRRRGDQRRRVAAGPAAAEAAVRAPHRDRSRSGRDRVAGRARRDARQRPQSSRRSRG